MGNTALTIAKHFGYSGIVEYLLDPHGASLDVILALNVCTLQMLVETTVKIQKFVREQKERRLKKANSLWG